VYLPVSDDASMSADWEWISRRTFLLDLTLSTLVMRILAALPIIGLHGFAIALAEKLLGKDRASREGGLSINPFSHLDVIGLLAFVFVGTGWTRPAPSHMPRRGSAWRMVPLFVAAGIAPVILLAVIAVTLLPWAAVSFSYSTAPLVGAYLATLVRLSIGFAIFNLIPLPPFSFGQILVAFSDRWRRKIGSLHTALGIVALVAGVLLLPWITGLIDMVVGSAFGDISMLRRAL
jgi:Zn-dependent protease